MSWRTHPVVLGLRSAGRKVGLNRAVARRVRALQGSQADPDASFLALVRPGDVVWDVGANLGKYALVLAQKVAPGGMVVAFEPSRDNLVRLNAALEGVAGVRVEAIALGDTNGTVTFSQGASASGGSSRIVSDGAAGAKGLSDAAPYEVAMARADTLIGQAGVPEQGTKLEQGADLEQGAEPLPAPHLIKLDVEGFERDVLDGFGVQLGNAALRGIYVEMHFSIMAARGRAQDAKAIEAMLKGAGFAITWVDGSHLLATRGVV